MVKIKKNKLAMMIVGTILATLLVAGAGLYAYSNFADVTLVSKSSYESMKDMSEKYDKLYKIQGLIDKNSLWDIDEETQMNAIYDGLFASLDDKYSTYMSEEDLKAWNDMMDGNFSGVGINFIENDDKKYEVTSVIEGSPAATAGIAAGDILVSVDGKTYDDSDEMAQNTRGEEGTKVELEYIHEGKTEKVSLIRAKIKEKTVRSAVLDGNVGYIWITAFEQGTADEFKAELADMETKNVSGLVVDLRNNGGGYTDEGIKIADMLLPEGTITYMEDKKGKKTYYNSDEDCTKLKYTVLVNENTASTSEIVAAALKDNKGGSIVGVTTYGKGIVQGTYSLGDNTAIKLTIMQYFSPNGTKIHGVGVAPDYQVELPADSTTDVQLNKALELLK